MANFVMTVFFIVSLTGTAFSEGYLIPLGKKDPKGTVAHMAYEWDNLIIKGKEEIHKPGADLQGPGDTYRYTIIIDNEYHGNPNYKILKAVIGIHIDDYDWIKGSGDTKPEWGKILINGSPAKFLVISPRDKRKPASSEFMEIAGDEEISPPNRLIPPYVFNVKDIIQNNDTVTIEIVNLREDGSTNSDAPYGNFIVNRVGSHIYYGKK
jgi:hypothetical protein